MQVEVELGAINTLTNISIAHGVLQPALVNGAGLKTAASNVIIASQDSSGPQVGTLFDCPHVLQMVQ
jgi:hypothetical protein